MTGTADPLAQARAALEEGNLETGEATIREILSREPGNADALCLAGYAAFLRSDFAAALPPLDRALASVPLHFEAHYLRAFALSGLDRLEDTLRAFRRVLILDPKCHPARARLCEVLFENGRNEEAMACLEEGAALGMDEATVNALRERGKDAA